MRILNGTEKEHLLFITFNTRKIFKEFKDLPEEMKNNWLKKFNDDNSVDIYDKRAEHYAEYSEISEITVGVSASGKIREKTFNNQSEYELLTEFVEFLEGEKIKNKYAFCGYNINKFMLPFMFKRLIVNKIKMPVILDTSGLKPWEVATIDLYDIWQANSLVSTDLKTVCDTLSIKENSDIKAMMEIFDILKSV